MDYRITALRDELKRMAEQHRKMAAELRTGTQGARETNSAAELSIASQNAQATAYEYAASELDRMSLPAAGAEDVTVTGDMKAEIDRFNGLAAQYDRYKRDWGAGDGDTRTAGVNAFECARGIIGQLKV